MVCITADIDYSHLKTNILINFAAVNFPKHNLISMPQ